MSTVAPTHRYAGRDWPTGSALAKAYEVSPWVFGGRLAYGWSLHRALGMSGSSVKWMSPALVEERNRACANPT